MKWLRSCLVVLLITCVVFLLFVGVFEFGLRWLFRGTVIDPAGGKEWLALHERAAVALLDPPPFITDVHGFLVGDPLAPGTNSEGYRTPEFDEPPQGRARVLFLGDSFTWGVAAQPLGRAFVDLVRERGYQTINLGVSAIGPVQYAAQAERYLPQLKPDVVCVMFYGWNDFLKEPAIRPGLQRVYMTNVGMLFATTEEGAQISFEEAVARHERSFAWWMTPRVAGLLGRTAIGRAAAHWNAEAARRQMDKGAAVEQLQRIREVAQEHGARLFLFLLPVRPSFAGDDGGLAELEVLFEDFAPLAPAPFGEDDYEPLPGEHFNNAGHARMAGFVADALAAAGYAPQADVPAWPPDPLGDAPSVAAAAALLALKPEQVAELRGLLARLNEEMSLLLYRLPTSGAQSPGAYLAALRREHESRVGLFSDECRVYLAAHTPHDSIPSYAVVVEQILAAWYRRIAAILAPEQLRVFKQIPPERLLDIGAGEFLLEMRLRRE